MADDKQWNVQSFKSKRVAEEGIPPETMMAPSRSMDVSETASKKSGQPPAPQQSELHNLEEMIPEDAQSQQSSKNEPWLDRQVHKFTSVCCGGKDAKSVNTQPAPPSKADVATETDSAPIPSEVGVRKAYSLFPHLPKGSDLSGVKSVKSAKSVHDKSVSQRVPLQTVASQPSQVSRVDSRVSTPVHGNSDEEMVNMETGAHENPIERERTCELDNPEIYNVDEEDPSSHCDEQDDDDDSLQKPPPTRKISMNRILRAAFCTLLLLMIIIIAIKVPNRDKGTSTSSSAAAAGGGDYSTVTSAPTASGETAAPAPSAAPTYDEPTLEITFQFDDFPQQTSWELVDNVYDATVFSVLPLTYHVAYDQITYRITVEMGREYSFTIFDSAGNGMCCEEPGEYTLSFRGHELVSGGGDFGSSANHVFTIPIIV
eukprot:Nitzschia sp. Nitz4//scaffold89_size161592//72978//74368//NITZ4_002379-RA/size161592-snap-gene-0.133-mRNA-1//1//CDS//3329559619//7886//frame0